MSPKEILALRKSIQVLKENHYDCNNLTKMTANYYHKVVGIYRLDAKRQC